jgi:hypothetical protein
MLPALTVGADDLDKAVDILDTIFTELGTV